ncbi:MAG: SH3 domain-containing protein [Chloroflexi bacterium]|nr:SH3 domain-containing protein [Chloroflexota bacterium]
MPSLRWLCLIALIVAGACAPQPDLKVPTQAVLPSPAPTLTAAPTHPPTKTPASIVPSVTDTDTPPPTVDLPTNPPPLTSFPALVGNINVTNAPGIILRSDPSLSADVIATLPGGSVVTAQVRTDDSQWIAVVTDQGVSGWVAASDVYALQSLTMLQSAGQGQSDFPPTLIVAAPSIAPSLTITPTSIPVPTQVTLGDIPAMEQRLQTTPILANLTAERVRWIFERGRDFGVQPRIFTTIGDSNTTNGDFLQPIGMGFDVYCNWGIYGYLQAVVDYFSVAPSEADANSFTHIRNSLTARKGFNSSAVLDPFWATSGACYPGESPLLCEYRIIRPSVAIIMLGGIDAADLKLTTATYNANMRAIVQTSIQQGIIPVLTTFVVLPDRGEIYERSLEFNMMLLDIANDEQIPLINLWAAAQTLPDDGIGPDHTHLKAQVGSYCAFDGAQQLYGGTLRNLLTLQTLDQLRQNVLTR